MRAVYIVSVAILLLAGEAIAEESVRPTYVYIGALSYRGDDETMQRWMPMAAYLTKTIPGHRFKVMPLDLQEMASAIKYDDVQFIVTNPGNYVELELRFGISRIATMQTMHSGKISTRFGAVIISKANNYSIKTLRDLRGKSFMSVSPDAFGGFQMAWRELLDFNIDPYKDFARLDFVGFPQDKVVTAVYNGEVDAASVRSETLMHMIDDGMFSLQDFRILNLQRYPEYALPTSTRLYPEGPFAKNKSTSRELATKVTLALLAMPLNHPAIVTHGAGWTVPLDYSSVHDLMKFLKIGPYLSLRETTLKALLEKYVAWIAAAIIFMMSLIAVVVYIYSTNRRLIDSDRNLRQEIEFRQLSQERLANYKNTLEERIVARTNEVEMANDALTKSQTTLHKLVFITSTTQLAHEEKIIRLLKTGREYFQTAAARLSSFDRDGKAICVVSGSNEIFSSHVGPLNSLCVQQVLTQFDKPLDLPNLNIKNYKSPGCGCEALNSYVATAVIVKGKPHCVLEFSDINVRGGLYTQWDHNLLQVMARWIGNEIEMQDAVEEMQRNQSELARVGRLTVMGEMAAGLAHELNQPLTGAINYSSGCLRRLKSDSFDKEKIIQGLERAVEGATMAADIIRHLREVTQTGESVKDLVELNEVVLKIVKLVSAEIRRHQTTVTLQLSKTLPSIIANGTQLEQVILNFIRNSLDAMDNIAIARREIIITTEQNQGNVRLFVIDFGSGIKSNSESNLFDAFYTTKSEGMGLGLSISRTIIEEHSGTITASNNPDTGACFSFEIPVSAGVNS